MRTLFALVVAAALLCAGCAPKGAQTQNDKAGVEKALREYLAKKGMSSDAMTVEVRQVQYQGDTAEADVVISAKSNPSATMNMRYTLKRTGPGSWEVQGRKEAAAGHGMPMPTAPEGPTPSPFGPPGSGAGAPGSATNPHAAQAPPAESAHAPGAKQSKPARPKSGK